MFLRVILAFVLALLVSPTFANDSNEVRKSLGGHPVCEASAAIVVPCPHTKHRECLLVGDNEKKKQLYLYGLKGDRLTKKHIEKVDLTGLPRTEAGEKFKIEDIEALARLPSGEIIVYGSHSRNKRCEKEDGERRLFAKGSLKRRAIDPEHASTVKADRHTCKSLFGENRNATMNEICAEIERREDLADDAESQASEAARKSSCNAVDPAFNLEGSVAIPESDGTARVWIGLRAPLINGKAVLLRQVDGLEMFRFDGVAFLDLKGPGEKGNYGIRELTLHGDKVWGIGGPPSDPPEDKDPPRHTLWSFKAAELEPGAEPVVSPSKRTLPPSAEGLAVVDKRAFVLIDGDQPKKVKKQCEIPSEYIVIDDFDS